MQLGCKPSRQATCQFSKTSRDDPGATRPGGLKSGPADRLIESAAITHHNTGELHRVIGVERCLRDQMEFGNRGAIATSSHTEPTGAAQFG